MRFLLIQNQIKTVPSVNLLSTLGSTASRGRDERIGMFGTGYIYALALVARHGLADHFKICLGNEVYTMVLKVEEAQDARGNVSELVKVALKKQNGGTYDLNIDARFGAMDWTDIGMAVREFISNAIDGQTDYDGKPQKIRVEVVENDRASKDFIRVYLPLTEEISDYMDDLKDNFLQFRFDYNPNKIILLKKKPGPARFYRKGVFVGAFGMNSLYDYNISNLELKECRIIDSYEAERKAAIALMMDKTGKLREYFIKGRDRAWEDEINTYYLNPNSYSSNPMYQEIKENYTKCFMGAHGDKVVACRTIQEANVLSNKGFNPIIIESSEIYNGLRSSGAPIIENVLTEDDRDGRMIVDTVPEHIARLDEIWNMLVGFGLTSNLEKPSIKSFRRVEQFDSKDAYAIYSFADKTILMNASYTNGSALTHSLLHELGHHITKAVDQTLPMQEFGYNVAARLFEQIFQKTG